MSNLINIRRDVRDPFYRYKMPRLVSKIEGRGNGIKTVIDNAAEIGRALNRLPSYITKFFAFELGTLCIINNRDNRYIVNGAHDAEKLQGLLDGFIGKFVLCTACENPETELQIDRDGSVMRQCKACGHRGGVDMAHRLVGFIEKNPPPTRRRAKNVAQEKQAEVESAIVDGMKKAVAFETDAAADAAQRRSEARKAEKERRRLEAYHVMLEDFGSFLEGDPSIDNETILEYVRNNKMPYEDAVIVAMQVLFAGDVFAATLKARLPLLKELAAGDRQKRFLLGSLERLVGVVNPKLLKQLPAILQLLYQHDLVDEPLFLMWNDKVAHKFVRKQVAFEVRQAAAPFIDWLQAEEEDESSGEYESDAE